MGLRKKVVHIVSYLMALMGLAGFAHGNSIENVLGFGYGLPYGGILGLNYELGINDYMAPTFGMGLLPDNVGWNAGFRLYYPGRESIFRGRVTVLYGVNTVLEHVIVGSDSEYDTETGFSGGVGFNWRYRKNWAFDLDLFIIDSQIPEGYKEEGSDYKVSLGFSRRW